MNKKTLIPNDFRDFLSIISFVGFLAISLAFLGNISWLTEHLTDFFLIIIGVAFVVMGNLFTIGKWAKDGIQEGEPIKILSIVIGLFAVIMGILMLSNVMVSQTFTGIIGVLGIVAGIFIIFDYVTKNN